MNPAFRRFFLCSDAAGGQNISYLMDPETLRAAEGGEESLIEITSDYAHYNLVCHQLMYRLDDEKQYVGIFVNITSTQSNQRKLDRLRAQTVLQARELLEHQIQMAENLAEFLGESTAKGEDLVEKLMLVAEGTAESETHRAANRLAICTPRNEHPGPVHPRQRRGQAAAEETALALRRRIRLRSHPACHHADLRRRHRFGHPAGSRRRCGQPAEGVAAAAVFAAQGLCGRWRRACRKRGTRRFVRRFCGGADPQRRHGHRAFVRNAAAAVGGPAARGGAAAEHHGNGGALVQEATCCLEPSDALLLMSDGITQAGIGGKLPQGWQSEGVVQFINSGLTDGMPPREIPAAVQREAGRLWTKGGDDCTVLMGLCRRGEILNLLTGPMANRNDDAAAVAPFMQLPGLKIVAGGTTAEIVARQLGRQVELEKAPRA